MSYIVTKNSGSQITRQESLKVVGFLTTCLGQRLIKIKAHSGKAKRILLFDS